MFELETGIIFWNTVSFALLVFLMYRWVLPPLLTLLGERQKTIAQSLVQAEETQRQSAAILSSVGQKLSEANHTAQKIVDQAKLEGQQLKNEIVAMARKEAEQLRLKAREDLRREQHQIMAAIKTQTADLVAAAAGRVLRQKVDLAQNRRLIEESLEECQC